ncbi:MAG: response regulator transcription factor [Coriobacteriales bacterium]|jgi:DNA-binding NarL/FixJ family response regulator|nr:response regulator transcription factor [Coriobacteriales bacterium]
MIRVVLADDDALVLQGLSAIVGSFEDVELVGSTSSGREALALCRTVRPDVAVLDIRMPGTDGIEVARALIAEGLAAPLLLTTFDEPDLITRALEVGACGYVLKNSPVQRLHSAIVTVAEGGTVFSPDVLDFIRSQMPAPAPAAFAGLTEREHEVVALIAEGLSNEQIAQRLFIANGTVRNHVSAILEKTGLEHRTQIAVRYYSGNTR